MGKRRKNADEEDNGFAIWGGYMEAKQAKLMDQFNKKTVMQVEKLSDVFRGVAILVNGYTKPNAEELKILMAQHGGSFHVYQVPATTHIIASNLPNVKINKLGSVPIVKPGWIEDSITLGRLLDYSKYLLYSNQSKTQPRLNFNVVPKSGNASSNGTGHQSISNTHDDFDDVVNSDDDFDNRLEVEEKRANSISSDNNKAENESELFNTTHRTLLNNCDSKTERELVKNEKCDNRMVENLCKNKNAGSDSFCTTGSNKPAAKTASDPKFLSEFYNNSRLHLIATLGAEFKQLVNDMREKADWKFPGLERIARLKKSRQNLPVVMHIDMDCFFVSVGLRTRPELRGKPVAVTHSKGGQTRNSVDRRAEIAMYKERLPDGADCRLEAIDNTCSLSEIASCSYEARRCGVKNGMFMGAALKLCPGLRAIPYDFQGYREVSNALYGILAEYTLDIEAVSCDEMYVDVTRILSESGLGVMEWAEHIRGVIIERTGCPCSTGFGGNRLQARLATRRAKPNGAFYLQQEDVEGYLMDTPLADLPGVGRATLVKLKSLGLETCGDVQMVSSAVLKNELGAKAGETIAEQARGVDRKPLKYEHERKSVSAEVNYGIRFKTNDEAVAFFESLAHEVRGRLRDVNMKAKCVTLKIMVRAQHAPTETAKYLGHGVCDSLSRSSTLNSATDDALTIFKEVKTLYEKLGVPFEDLRGVGIQLSRLEKEVAMNSVLKSFLSKENVKQTREKTDNSNTGSLKQDGEITTRVSHNGQIIGNGRTKEDENLSAAIAINGSRNVSVYENKNTTVNTTTVGKRSGRGRPKGSRNSNTAKKPRSNVTNLTSYFKCTQKDRAIVKSQNVSKTVQPIDIDMSVLDQLPPDIKAEVIREYRLNVPQKNRVQNETSPKAAVVQTVAGGSKEKCAKRKAGFDTLNRESFKAMLSNWLHSRPKPHDVDVRMLADHFKRMASDRKIEDLHVLLKYLHRIIEEKADCTWHAVYFQIVTLIQEGMMAKYGGRIMAPKRFNCHMCPLNEKTVLNAK